MSMAVRDALSMARSCWRGFRSISQPDSRGGFLGEIVQDMLLFYLACPPERIWQTVSAKSDGSEKHATPSRISADDHAHRKRQTLSGESGTWKKWWTESAEFDPMTLAVVGERRPVE